MDDSTVVSLCVHQWLIEPPNGTDSLRGYCTKCQQVRTFPASPDTSWENNADRAKHKHPAL